MGRSRNTILKRQRELKKAEKAAVKQAARHGKTIEGFSEPRPTVTFGKDGQIEETPESDSDETSG